MSTTIKLKGRVGVKRLAGRINLVPSENAGGPLQAKTVYPSHSEQTIAPDEDYYGLAVVTVKPVPRVPACVASVVSFDDPYKQIRLTITNFSRGNVGMVDYANVGEFAIYDENCNNLALSSGATYTANNNTSDCPPEQAFDGDVQTTWHSNWGQSLTTNWLQVNLDSFVLKENIKAFGITPHDERAVPDCPWAFTISGSFDGTSWDTLYEHSGNTDGWFKGTERLFKLGEMKHYARCCETTGGTSLTGRIEANSGDWILATVTTRSATTLPEGWTVLRESTVLNADASNQRMFFLCKQMESKGSAECKIEQSESARIYINLIRFSDIQGFAYHEGTEVYSDTAKTTSIEVQRPRYGKLVWGCSSHVWAGSTPYGAWQCGNLTPICLNEKFPARQANFIDENPSEAERVFVPMAETYYIIDCVEILQ